RGGGRAPRGATRAALSLAGDGGLTPPPPAPSRPADLGLPVVNLTYMSDIGTTTTPRSARRGGAGAARRGGAGAGWTAPSAQERGGGGDELVQQPLGGL